MTTGADWLDSARRLVESFRAAAPGPAGAGEARATGGTTAGAPDGGDCRWCPICQAAAVVRGERPEVSAALADILVTTAAALRQFAGEEGAPSDSGTEGEPAAAPEPTPAPAPGPVQRIELT